MALTRPSHPLERWPRQHRKPLLWVASLLAAVFDYVENIGLTIALWHRPLDPWPLVSSVAAALKFFCIAVAVLYALGGLAASMKRASGAD